MISITLPAVTTASAAVAPGAPLLHAEAPGNVCLDFHYGDSEQVAAAFARAAHVTTLSLRNNRIVCLPMEPRSAIAEYDPDADRLILRLGCQGVFGQRNLLSGILGVPVEKLHVLTGNVGGSFGMKASAYPEYICLLHAARTLGRPVKWTDERSESFLSDSHGRDHEMTAELALDADGKFLALRVTGYGNLGAWLSNATTIPPTLNTVKNIIGVYATPLIEVSSKCMFTNTTPVGAYRGAGRPEGNYYMERLVETAAREIGIDRVELRRRNHIQPEQMPYRAPSGMLYDSGEFPTVMEKALNAADWDGYPVRQAETRARGKVRGRGIGHYLEVTADAGNEMGGIRFESDGSVTIITGTLDYGQGHASPFAQVLADRLGVPFERIKAAARRFRPTDRRRRHRRIAIDDAERRRHHRRERPGHRAGQADRRALPGGRGRRYRILPRPLQHRRNRSRHRHHGAGSTAARRRAAAGRCAADAWMSATSSRACRRRFPTAATSPRSNWIRTPARSRSSATPR